MSGARVRTRRVVAVSAAVLAVSLTSACAPRSGLFPLQGSQVGARPLGDDLDDRSLKEAVRRSARYFTRVPDATFRYGDLSYSGAEMEASMGLFLDILERQRGEERIRSIKEKFLFFESRNSRGEAFFTGYYEPVIPGSLGSSDDFAVPLYAVPGDLLTIDLGPFAEMGLLPGDLENGVLKGKLEGARVVPYDGREQITYDSSLEGRAEVLLYLRDRIELSFLQIQGSGLILLGDGTAVRVNYADQNGHPYRAIGRALLDRIPREEMSLQRIREYLYAHPAEVKDILSYNPSYVFFRTVEEGPLGNIEVPLTPGRSVAMDTRAAPRGGLVYFETRYPRESMAGRDEARPISRFGVVQDTGGAIRGHGRVDVFWGSGEEAERIAGPMKEPGRVWLLVARKEYLVGFPPGSEEPLEK